MRSETPFEFNNQFLIQFPATAAGLPHQVHEGANVSIITIQSRRGLPIKTPSPPPPVNDRNKCSTSPWNR